MRKHLKNCTDYSIIHYMRCIRKDRCNPEGRQYEKSGCLPLVWQKPTAYLLLAVLIMTMVFVPHAHKQEDTWSENSPAVTEHSGYSDGFCALCLFVGKFRFARVTRSFTLHTDLHSLLFFCQISPHCQSSFLARGHFRRAPPVTA